MSEKYGEERRDEKPMATAKLVSFGVWMKRKGALYYSMLKVKHTAIEYNRESTARLPTMHELFRNLYLDDVVEKAIPAARTSLLLAIKRGLDRSHE